MRIAVWFLASILLLGCGLPHSNLRCEDCEDDASGSPQDGEPLADASQLAEDAFAGPEAGADGGPAADVMASSDADADSDAGPRCGDGVCSGSENCEQCPADCIDGCILSCVSCENDGQCGDGQRCVPRACDGRRACHTMRTDVEPAHGCVEVSGLQCTRTLPYQPCVSDEECGAGSTCMSMGSARVCRQRCSSGAQCPSYRAEGLVESCSGDDGHCYLSCQRSSECPFGLQCLPFTGGVYGFCGSR